MLDHKLSFFSSFLKKKNVNKIKALKELIFVLFFLCPKSGIRVWLKLQVGFFRP